MNISCPSCRAAIPAEDVNVSTDLALCRQCGKTFSLSKLLALQTDPDIDLANPPKGAWFRREMDGFSLGATTRSLLPIFLIPFTCVWAGSSVGGIYGSQIRSGQFDPMSSLFGIPFLLGSIVLVSMCVIHLAGKIEVTLHGDRLRIFTGVGRLGWYRNFSWSDFQSVREATGTNGMNWNRSQFNKLSLEGKRQVLFATNLNQQRRYFMLKALRRLLLESQGSTATKYTPLIS